jgi:hypothetical protein
MEDANETQRSMVTSFYKNLNLHQEALPNSNFPGFDTAMHQRLYTTECPRVEKPWLENGENA